MSAPPPSNPLNDDNAVAKPSPESATAEPASEPTPAATTVPPTTTQPPVSSPAATTPSSSPAAAAAAAATAASVATTAAAAAATVAPAGAVAEVKLSDESKVGAAAAAGASVEITSAEQLFPAVMCESLKDMGFTDNMVARALYHTGGASVDNALQYILQNMDDPLLQMPLVVPASALSAQQQTALQAEDSSDSMLQMMLALQAAAGKELSPPEPRYKMVLVARTDLKMGKGKLGAQCAHAAVGMFARMSKHGHPNLKPWMKSGQKKIVLKVSGKQALEDLIAHAEKEDVPTYLVCDAGRTQVAAGSETVLAVGPAEEEVLNKITGHLKLM